MRPLRWFWDWPAPLFLATCGSFFCWISLFEMPALLRWRGFARTGFTSIDSMIYVSIGLVLVGVSMLRIRLTLRRRGPSLRSTVADQAGDQESEAPRFTCPCCGYRTLDEPPNSYEVCKVCFWEDDGVQLLDPAFEDGANGPSLMECQVNFQRKGACEDRFLEHVRLPRATERRDPEWRPVRESDLGQSRTPGDLSAEESGRPEAWYYWKRA